jgi:hypothetical protein
MLSLLLVGGITIAGQQTTPDGYMPRGFRPPKGMATGMKVTDLGKGARTYRINIIAEVFVTEEEGPIQ